METKTKTTYQQNIINEAKALGCNTKHVGSKPIGKLKQNIARAKRAAQSYKK